MKKYTIALFLHFLKNLAISAQFPTLFLHFRKDLAISAQFPDLILHFQENLAIPAQFPTLILHFLKKMAIPAQSLALSHEVPSCRYIIIMNLNPMQETIKFP